MALAAGSPPVAIRHLCTRLLLWGLPILRLASHVRTAGRCPPAWPSFPSGRTTNGVTNPFPSAHSETAPMPDLADGETVEMQGSGAKPYLLKNTGGVFSCSCPAWRNQSIPIERRTCKHLKKLRGEALELARVAAASQGLGGSAGSSAAGASGVGLTSAGGEPGSDAGGDVGEVASSRPPVELLLAESRPQLLMRPHLPDPADGVIDQGLRSNPSRRRTASTPSERYSHRRLRFRHST